MRLLPIALLASHVRKPVPALLQDWTPLAPQSRVAPGAQTLRSSSESPHPHRSRAAISVLSSLPTTAATATPNEMKARSAEHRRATPAVSH